MTTSRETGLADGPDWPPRSSASGLPDGTQALSSIGQKWEARNGQWVRCREEVPEDGRERRVEDALATMRYARDSADRLLAKAIAENVLLTARALKAERALKDVQERNAVLAVRAYAAEQSGAVLDEREAIIALIRREADIWRREGHAATANALGTVALEIKARPTSTPIDPAVPDSYRQQFAQPPYGDDPCPKPTEGSAVAWRVKPTTGILSGRWYAKQSEALEEPYLSGSIMDDDTKVAVEPLFAIAPPQPDSAYWAAVFAAADNLRLLLTSIPSKGPA